MKTFSLDFTFILCLYFDSVSAQYDNYSQQQGVSANQGNINWQPLKNRKGEVTHYYPLPSDWVLHSNVPSEQPFITTGNKTVVYLVNASRNNQTLSPDQIANSIVHPYLSKNGGRFLNSVDLPKIDQVSRNYGALLYSTGYSQKEFKTKGFEYDFSNGTKCFSIVSVIANYTHSNSYIVIYNLVSTSEYYETAKQALIFALENRRYNQEQLMNYNRNEMALERQRWNNWARSQPSNSGATASSSHYSGGSSSGTDAFLQGVIREEKTVSGGGYSGDVSIHHKYTWVNESGETIHTDDPNYDPNSDTSRYHHSWSRMQ